jgi:cell division septum initiation protein DivIVA
VDAPKNNKDLYALRYAEFVVPLVKAVQELSNKNDELEQRIKKLEKMLGTQSSSSINNAAQNISLSSASLSQNVPNPFKNTTTIQYSLPQQYNSAKIIISSNGKMIKEVNLTGKGQGSINIDASDLAATTYNYTLYIDGKLADSKQMISTK